MNTGTSKLASILTDRMRQESSSPLVLDFGSIQGDFSLLTNTFPVPIPKSDYTVCRQVSLGATGGTLTQTSTSGNHTHSEGTHSGHESGDGSHSHTGGTHAHPVLIPEKMRSIRPGDRVLVAWVQNEAVVIDIILPASSV